MAGIGEDGSLLVTGRAGQRELPAEYVREHVELAFTITAYGAQGETVRSAHFALGETTGAASAYVAMTRGRHHNIAHLVAESVDDARSQWVEVFSRDRADLGPGHAAQRAADDIDRYGPRAPSPSTVLQAAALPGRPTPATRNRSRLPTRSRAGSAAEELPTPGDRSGDSRRLR
ncbi:hypothetical protein [Nocardioides sp. B-3]|uniref:hypothetical protein n=1 Tax=Nocardioides sp. B-3 TaxID=2895565 RepID=UPI0021524A01|nr:hypothetical protein [Nocardioides sp. B-3]UUZ60960.1 hypothetical protein LP418_09865 [Nocardioides sp. B-3]